MPNPSELQRQSEEALNTELSKLKYKLRIGYNGKFLKNEMLRRIREIEAELGIESKSYNSTEF